MLTVFDSLRRIVRWSHSLSVFLARSDSEVYGKGGRTLCCSLKSAHTSLSALLSPVVQSLIKLVLDLWKF